MRWQAWASATAIVLFVCGRARAQADPLLEIESAVDQADFDRAQVLATQELSSGRLDRGRVARVHLLMGIIAAAKRDGAAEASFRKALALEPALGLPPSAGPHIAASFARARETVNGRTPLSLTVAFAADPDPSRVVVDVHLNGNAESMVNRLVVRGEGIYDVRLLREPGLHVVVSLPTAPRCISLEASALDEHGNEIWPSLARTQSCRPVTAAATPSETTAPMVQPRAPVDPGASSPSLPASFWIAGAATGGLAIVTTILGISALDQRKTYDAANRDPARSPDERKELRTSALNAEHYATIAGIATAAGAVTTTAIFFLRPKSNPGAGRSPAAHPSASIAVGPWMSGGVVFVGSF
jgi:hypothetical protein